MFFVARNFILSVSDSSGPRQGGLHLQQPEPDEHAAEVGRPRRDAVERRPRVQHVQLLAGPVPRPQEGQH